MYEYDLNPEVGADNMRFLAGIRDDDSRKAAEKAFVKGKSPDTVKMAVRNNKAEEEPSLKLEKEKQRLQRTIASLEKRLEEVERELETL
jgi:hypothetical protein